MTSLPTAATGLATKACRVLVVDDNEDSAELTRMYAEMRGHSARVAYDSHSALAAADDFRPDVALVDVHLGGDSGIILAQQLRAIPGLAGCRLIAISGLPQDVVQAGAEAAGITFHRHVRKPFERDELLRAIEGEG